MEGRNLKKNLKFKNKKQQVGLVFGEVFQEKTLKIVVFFKEVKISCTFPFQKKYKVLLVADVILVNGSRSSPINNFESLEAP